MDPTWNWTNYGQIHGQIQAQANYYAAATRQLRGAQSGSNAGQAINPTAAQNHHSNQNQMSSYPQNQMTSWFALHGHPHHTHPGFNPTVHQTSNHTDHTAFATNPFSIHGPQSTAHPTVPSYDAPGFLNSFQSAAAATAAAKANYLQPNHANFKQLTAKDYEMNLRAAGFTHSHCGAMQASTHGPSMAHPDAAGMSAATGAHLFSHLAPTTWRHHTNLMASQHHNRSGPFGPLPHEETNLMQQRAGHHGSTSNMSAHANSSSNQSNKSCSVESNKHIQTNQKHNSSGGFFNQSVHSSSNRSSASTFDHYPSSKLAHPNQPQAEHHYLAMQAAAAAVGMSAGSNQHVLANSRTPTQCQYPSAMNFSGADIFTVAVGQTSSLPKHASNNQCHVRGTNVTGNNSYCNLMMGTVPNLNGYTQSHTHVNSSLSGNVSNHGNNSRSSSAASNHGMQGTESSGSYGYNSPSTNHPHSPYQQRNTSSVAAVTVSSQATPVTAVPPNGSNVQDFTNSNYLNQGNAYTIGNPGASSARIDYPTPPSSAQIISQAQPGSSQGQDENLSHYSANTQNPGNTYPNNAYSPYQAASKMSTSTSGPGSNNSVVSNAGSSSCMVEAAARAAAASSSSNGNSAYHHSSLSNHGGSLPDSDADACLSNIVNVTPISDGMADIGKLNDSQMNSTLNDVLSGQGIDFQSISYASGVDPTVNYGAGLRLDGQNPGGTVKKKAKVKKHKKKDKPKTNERISVNSNALSYSLPMHYNYNESYNNETCNSYQNSLHQTPTAEQHMHSQTSMLPMTGVAEASQCFDPATLGMQQTLMDESMSHLSTQQHQNQQHQQQQQPQQQLPPTQSHSQSTQAHPQPQPDQQQQAMEFEKSQQNECQSQQLVAHHQGEESQVVLAATEHLVNEKDLISDLEDDLSFLTETATDCEPPASNDIGTQAGTQLMTEAISSSCIETSSVSTSTECPPTEACTTTTVLPTVVSSSEAENSCALTASNTNGNILSDKHSPSSGFQQNLFTWYNESMDGSGKSGPEIMEEENIPTQAIEINSINNKKKKHKDGKESKQKSSTVVNGAKTSKTSKKNNKANEANACEELEKVLPTASTEITKPSDVGKKLGDKEQEAKFFKVRPSMNNSAVPTNVNSNNGVSLQSVTKQEKSSKKRKLEDHTCKDPADEYEFPDSPTCVLTTKKSKKNSASENSNTKKKAVTDKTSNTAVVTKKTANTNTHNKVKVTIPANQNSLLIKQQSNVNCDNLNGELSVPKRELNGFLDQPVEAQVETPEIKQTVHANERNDLNGPVKQKPSACQKSSQPKLQTQPVGKKLTSESAKKASVSNAGSTSAKTNPNVSMQSAGTNTPRRRSQDKKALTVREGLMRTGDFVVSIDEMNCELPMIWRIEGKSLLQRFEPSEQDNLVVYTNTSSYSAWNPTVRQRYTGVDVRIMGCSRTKIVVEKLGLTKTNPNVNGDAPVVERCKGTSSGSSYQHQENFEVFTQTLISQALDPNFIAEIVKENDEYFLSHVQAIDEYCGRKKSRFFSKVKWDAQVVKCVETFPTFTIIPQHNVGDLRCRLCHDNWSTQILNFSGQPYDQMTLELKDPVDLKQTKYAACDLCKERITLFSCLHHQKYNFYMKCKEKVDEMRAGDENKESHVILEQCLSDTEWIQSLFKQLEKIWCDCDELR